MLALQNMATPKDSDTSLADITNELTPTPFRNPQSFDAISTQILSLTTIATNLQREMVQLSRRSKDNATDLISLKEATNSRDEDIRKSLKDLASSIAKKIIDPQPEHSPHTFTGYRSPGALLLENKAFTSPSGIPKSSSVPRGTTPSVFTESEISTSSYSLDGPASIALLEKIWRDMGTKDGQDEALALLSEIKARPANVIDAGVNKKLEEILGHIKHKPKEDPVMSRALVPRRDNGNRVINSTQDDGLKPAPLAVDNPRVKAADFVNEDLQKLLKKMKDSITEGGGMTAEVKAHVRELRGEVLGMGRDIARRLDHAGDSQAPSQEEITAIVQDGLTELRDQMENLIREKRRQSSSSVSSRRSIDGQEVYAAVKNALVEFPVPTQQQPNPGIEREEILEAVREAWETYKPEIELQNFGLERDEILTCLKEGLQSYKSGTTYDEVLDAVREGLQDFRPPAPIESEANLTREEMLMCVRECLDTYEFPVAAPSVTREIEITREDVLEAVKEGLLHQAPITREIEFNREDLFDAVKAGIEGVPTPMGGVGEKVMEKMEELIDDMRVEFKQYSVANGGDTEQVLDAMKDGFEVLRSDIESYVDRAADVTGKDEIVETVRSGLENLRIDLEKNPPSSNTRSGENTVLLDAMEKEFEHLRQTIATTMLGSGNSGPDREEILETIRDGLAPENSRHSETISVMQEEFKHLRETFSTTMMRAGSAGEKEEIIEAIREVHDNLRAEAGSQHEREGKSVASGELLDAFHEGLDTLRGDLERIVNKPLDMTVNYEILETLKDGLASFRADLQAHSGTTAVRDGEVVVADENVASSYRGDLTNLEMMITQLRIKVEALDSMPTPPQTEDPALKQQIENLESAIREMQASLEESSSRGQTHAEGIAMRDDMEALETLLRNTKAKIEELSSSENNGLARTSHLDSVEAAVKEARDAIHDANSDAVSRKDFSVVEALLKEVRAALEELRDKALDGGVSKADIEALETICMDNRAQIDELPLPNPETLPTKTDLETLAEIVRGCHNQVTEGNDLSAAAFEARKTEHGGIADKVEDVKLILEDIREELKVKIDEGYNGVKDVAEALESISASFAAVDTTTSIDDLRKTIEKDMDALHSATDGSRDYHEANHSVLLDKQKECRDSIIIDVNAKLDARFDELMTKYDDAQLAAAEKERSLENKEAEQAEALSSTKNVVEDLRMLVDTLGSTLTESCDRIGEDSKTVFVQVEQANSKLDHLMSSSDGKAEHQATRAEISKTLASVEGVQAHASEYNPKILSAIHDVLSIVGQHYEQAKSSTEEIMTSVQAIPGSIPLPAIAPSDPSPELLRDIPVAEKYDDTHIHAKLDKLISHATEAATTVAQVTLLEQFREQFAATSTKFDDFVAAHESRTDETNKQKEKEAEEAAVALEKRRAHKAIVESDVVRLTAEKKSLSEEVRMLTQRKEELSALKSRMQADLSSLETALGIRREELHVMEIRADGLERRILDGILDHSRSLLTTSRPPSSLNQMNLKRVTSNASNTTATSRKTSAATAVPSNNASALSSGVGMALKRRQAPKASVADSRSSNADRRILSLSTLGGNRGATTERSLVPANAMAAGTVASKGLGVGPMKRSHSVKSNFPSRKSSWGGTKVVGMSGDDGTNTHDDKENSILDEVDEEEVEGSQAGTEGRTSYSGTYTGTGSYGEGSFISNDDKRDSFDASTVGTIGTRDFAVTEDGHSDGEIAEKEESKNAGEMVLYGHQSDSGIGTDIPTAQLPSHGSGSDYFKR